MAQDPSCLLGCPSRVAKEAPQGSALENKQYALLHCRLSSKMPIQTEKGNLHVDLKALGQVLWRSTIVHIFR